MHIHKLERVWLIFGTSMLVVFLITLGIGTFVLGMAPPHSGDHHSIDPTTVDIHPPFDEPGLTKVGDQHYEAVMTSFVFSYDPGVIEVPRGATVDFIITSKDVVHGFQIVGTTVNMMIVPGEVTEASFTFDEPGEYLILCNEYCGAYHEVMQARIIVT